MLSGASRSARRAPGNLLVKINESTRELQVLLVVYRTEKKKKTRVFLIFGMGAIERFIGKGQQKKTKEFVDFSAPRDRRVDESRGSENSRPCQVAACQTVGLHPKKSFPLLKQQPSRPYC